MYTTYYAINNIINTYKQSLKIKHMPTHTKTHIQTQSCKYTQATDDNQSHIRCIYYQPYMTQNTIFTTLNTTYTTYDNYYTNNAYC